MKIAHILWGLSTGGTECMLVDIVNEQVKDNQVLVLVVDDNINKSLQKKIDPRVKFFCCKRKPGSKDVLAVLKLNFQLFLFRPSVTHLHMGYGLGRIVFWPGTKVRTVHATTNSSDEYHMFKRIFAISTAVKKEIKNQGYDSKIVYNGIKTQQVKNGKSNKKNDTCVHIVQVGRLLMREKGQNLLIEAVAQLKKSFGEEKIQPLKIHFVGFGADLEALQIMIDKYDLKNHFIFEGLKDRDWVYQHLCDFDLFVQPSYLEGFGLTVAEAVAAKVPVLVSDIDGPLEILTSKKKGKLLGWVFKSGDVNDLSQKLAAFLENGYDQNLVEEAYVQVVENFDVCETANNYLLEYKNLTSKE